MTRVATRVVRRNKQLTQELTNEATKGVRRAVSRAVTIVHRTAVDSIQNAPRGGEQYIRYGEGQRRVGRASAAGEPPASDTGFLANNIMFEVESGGLSGRVERRAAYSTHLEFGTKNMRARPFMQPALEEHKKKITAMVRDELKKAIKGL